MKTKTKLLVDFCKSGLTTYTVYGLVCTHNEGTCSYTMKEIQAIIKGKIVDCKVSLKDMKLLLNEEQGILEVYEDGENLTYSVHENVYYDLKFEGNTDKELADKDALNGNPVYERNKKEDTNLWEEAEKIIFRKGQGIDCNEDERAIIKQYMRHKGLSANIIEIFPIEAAEVAEENEAESIRNKY